jgi:hypothetical protein
MMVTGPVIDLLRRSAARQHRTRRFHRFDHVTCWSRPPDLSLSREAPRMQALDGSVVAARVARFVVRAGDTAVE